MNVEGEVSQRFLSLGHSWADLLALMGKLTRKAPLPPPRRNISENLVNQTPESVYKAATCAEVQETPPLMTSHMWLVRHHRYRPCSDVIAITHQLYSESLPVCWLCDSRQGPDITSLLNNSGLMTSYIWLARHHRYQQCSDVIASTHQCYSQRFYQLCWSCDSRQGQEFNASLIQESSVRHVTEYSVAYDVTYVASTSP
ncbi:hypothetical protein J6590_085615 [Homalodisca vitripennis]|nr:hypothetical protein J6590_085615 [Homalodisca vitripennis]